ncbi:PTS transporter subunit EIIC [uncultured Lactobacillus sp.]|uniref:PTS transporter subunit EIIC n=1 Tax=uncultured Lactobacillus sp. TaxID=153152 RepID=UPI00261423BB|nr:PTS transporter subunit EIIC [uncultured Lactobacillus sp.]
MVDRLIFKMVVWVKRRSFFRIAERTLTILMPLAIIGSIFQFMWRSVFSPDSLISNIFYFDNWLPDPVFDAAWYASQGLSSVIFNSFGLLVAYFGAQYTARYYHKDAQMAGIAGMLSLLLCAYRFQDTSNFNITMNFNWRFLGIHSFLFALVIGYIVGLIFRFWGVDFHHQHTENSDRIEWRAFASFRPTAIALLVGLVIGIFTSIIQVRMIASNVYQFFQNEGQNNLNLWTFIPLLALALFLNWFGIGEPLNSLTANMGSGTNVANLNYALEHGSSWNIPNKFVGNALYQSYGKFGGSGVLLALLIVILLVYKHDNTNKVARWSFIPTFFGSNQGALVGVPIILNPMYLFSYVLIPVLNMLIAALFIQLHLIPASAYQVLSGTPGPIVSFMATNGNWSALIFSMLLFAGDILLYWPVVKIAAKVQTEIENLNAEEAGFEYVH